MDFEDAETLTPTTSTNVNWFKYSPSRGELIVEFKSGSRYSYSDVPQQVMDDLRNSHMRGESAGKFITERIKGYYDAKKIS